jgi:hypothetical protein
MTQLFPRSEIALFVNVIQDDGGARSAAINAVSLALISAGIPMYNFLCSCSASLVDSTPLIGACYKLVLSQQLTVFVDMNYLEKSSGGPELVVAAGSFMCDMCAFFTLRAFLLDPQSKRIILTQMDSKLPLDAVNQVSSIC